MTTKPMKRSLKAVTKTQIVSCRITQDMYDRLQAIAKLTRRVKGAVASRLIEDCLPHAEKFHGIKPGVSPDRIRYV